MIMMMMMFLVIVQTHDDVSRAGVMHRDVHRVTDYRITLLLLSRRRRGTKTRLQLCRRHGHRHVVGAWRMQHEARRQKLRWCWTLCNSVTTAWTGRQRRVLIVCRSRTVTSDNTKLNIDINWHLGRRGLEGSKDPLQRFRPMILIFPCKSYLWNNVTAAKTIRYVDWDPQRLLKPPHSMIYWNDVTEVKLKPP